MEYSRKEVERVLREMQSHVNAVYSEGELAELVHGTGITTAAIQARVDERERARRQRARRWRTLWIAALSSVAASVVVGFFVLVGAAAQLGAAHHDAERARDRVAIEQLHVEHARRVLQADPQNRAALRELADGLDNADAWRGAYRYNARAWNARGAVGRAAAWLFQESTTHIPDDL